MKDAAQGNSRQPPVMASISKSVADVASNNPRMSKDSGSRISSMIKKQGTGQLRQSLESGQVKVLEDDAAIEDEVEIDINTESMRQNTNIKKDKLQNGKEEIEIQEDYSDNYDEDQ